MAQASRQRRALRARGIADCRDARAGPGPSSSPAGSAPRRSGGGVRRCAGGSVRHCVPRRPDRGLRASLSGAERPAGIREAPGAAAIADPRGRRRCRRFGGSLARRWAQHGRDHGSGRRGRSSHLGPRSGGQGRRLVRRHLERRLAGARGTAASFRGGDRLGRRGGGSPRPAPHPRPHRRRHRGRVCRRLQHADRRRAVRRRDRRRDRRPRADAAGAHVDDDRHPPDPVGAGRRPALRATCLRAAVPQRAPGLRRPRGSSRGWAARGSWAARRRRRGFARLTAPPAARGALGGLLVGLCALPVPGSDRQWLRDDPADARRARRSSR